MVRNLLEPVGKPLERAGGSLERTGGSLEPVRKPLQPARKSASIVYKACYAFQTSIPRVFRAILRDFHTSLAVRRTRILRAGSQCLTDQDDSETVLHPFILKSDHDPDHAPKGGSSMRSRCAAFLRVDVGCHAQVCAGMCVPRAIVRVAGTCPRRLGPTQAGLRCATTWHPETRQSHIQMSNSIHPRASIKPACGPLQRPRCVLYHRFYRCS
jgi:hypothetical protein